MHENHAHEQYFFDNATLARLAALLAPYKYPCLLNTPMLARHLHAQNPRVRFRLLDIDDRFADLPGFLHWDLYRPTPLAETFDLILCDPPFFNVSLSQLFTAIRLLANFNYAHPVMIAYLARRESALLGTFARFNLTPTGLVATYQTVQPSPKAEIHFYANFPLPQS